MEHWYTQNPLTAFSLLTLWAWYLHRVHHLCKNTIWSTWYCTWRTLIKCLLHAVTKRQGLIKTLILLWDVEVHNSHCLPDLSSNMIFAILTHHCSTVISMVLKCFTNELGYVFVTWNEKQTNLQWKAEIEHLCLVTDSLQNFGTGHCCCLAGFFNFCPLQIITYMVVVDGQAEFTYLILRSLHSKSADASCKFRFKMVLESTRNGEIWTKFLCHKLVWTCYICKDGYSGFIWSLVYSMSQSL